MTSIVAKHYPFANFPAGASTTLSSTLLRSFTPSLADAGTGEVSGRMSDAALAAIEPGDIITLDVVDSASVSHRAFAFLYTDGEYIAIDPNEEAGQTITLDGPGHLAVVKVKGGVIEPPGGTGRSPIVLDVIYDYTHPDYVEDGSWVFANDLLSVTEAKSIADGGSGLWPSPWAKDMPNGRIIGPTAGTTSAAPAGKWYGRDTFSTPFDGVHLLFLTADNAAIFAIDGKPIASVGGAGNITTSGFGSSASITPVSLSAGTHTPAFEVTNYPPFAAPNPSGIAAQIYIPGYPPTLVWQTSGGCQINDYPAETPGMTPGKVMLLALAQQQAQGRLTYITPTFTATKDSANVDWPTFAQIAAKAGSDDVYDLFVKIMAVYADVEMDPSSWNLNAWIWGTHAPASGVVAEVGNLTSLHYKRQAKIATELMILWSGGWSRSGSGEVQSFLQLGPENTAEEVGRLATKALGVFASPQEEVSFTYEPRNNTELPYANANLIPGATLTFPARTGGTASERVMQLTCSYSKDGERVLVQAIVKGIIQQTQERILQAIKST